jgi:sugar lactone lactonase YvrE
VTTLAGAPFSARQVDGVGASARFSQLNGIAVDAAGLLYVVDGPNGRICRITPDGAVTTLAGASSAGFADGAGSAAIFSQPYGVAVDGAGRLYVSDSDNNRVRIGVFGFDPAIIISPQDQSAEAGYPVALSAFAVGAQPLSYQWRQNGIDLAGATNASFAITFSQPTNAGSYSLVVTNALGSVTSSPPAIVTIAAVPPAIAQQPISQTSPAGSNVFLSVSASGSPPLRFQWQFNGTNLVGATNATLFLGSAPTNDTGMYTVVVSNAFGVETSHVAALTVAEIGITELPQDSEIVLGYPFNLGVAAFGNPMIGYQWQFDGTNIPGAFTSSLILTNVSFADGGDYRSIVFDLIPTNGYVLRAPIGAPKATLTVVPPYDFVTLAGTNVAGAVDGDGTSAQFNMPTGIVVDKDGFVYVSDASNHTIRKITPSGTVTTFAGLAGSPGAVDGAIVDARFNRPNGIAIDGSGNLYVADRGNATIRKISSDGTVVTFAGSAGLRGYQDGIGPAARFFTPLNVACDRVGNVYVADETLRKVTPEGVVTTLAGPPGVNGQPIADAYGMAPDALGNLYISEDFKLTIALIGPDGLVTPVAGLFRTPGATNGSGAFARFSAPSGMAMDLSGNMFLADASLIRKITPGGVVTTIAGLEGISGFADGSGQAALFNQPLGIAVDGAGTVYVADTRNNAIRVGRPPLTSLPSLQIAWNGNQAVISWPVSTVGFVLETSPTLLARSWAAITDGITISGDQSVFQTNVNASPAFFRLRRQ